jgi:hypothetical protein
LPPAPPPAAELELDVVELALPDELVACELVVVPPFAVLVFVVPPQAIHGRPAPRMTREKSHDCFLTMSKYQGGASVNSAKWSVCAVAAGR